MATVSASHSNDPVSNADRSATMAPAVSIVVPVFNETENLNELHERLVLLLTEDRFRQSEVVFVSDGSTDGTEEVLEAIVAADARFSAIFLTRNFGHQAAVSVGLRHAMGELVVVIDGDLQDPPEVIPRLVDAIDNGVDVAFGVRRNRKESLLKRVAYKLFYRLLKLAASIDIPLDSGDFCCMRRDVVDHLNRLPERNRFIRGLRAWIGYRQVGVEYERAARFAGEPKYTIRKLIGLTYDGLFSFSTVPIRIMQVLGFLVSATAILVAGIYFIWYFVSSRNWPPGFATLTISIWFLGGIQLFFLGVIGEYVTRAFDETRARPVALVRQIRRNQTADSSHGERLHGE